MGELFVAHCLVLHKERKCVPLSGEIHRADEPADICQRRLVIHNTIYAADWSVIYPIACDAHGVMTLLRGLQIKYWS